MDTEERILHAQHIKIYISPRATNSDIQIARTAACGLTKLGKHVQIVSQEPLPSKNTFSVTLRGMAPLIADVTHEKENNDLNLHFTLQKGQLPPENVSFSIAPRDDLTIIVGDNKAQYNYKKIHTFIIELLLNHQDPSFRLLGTILFKLENMPSGTMYATTLTRRDLRIALTSPKHMPSIIQDLRQQFGDQSSYVFFLEKTPEELQVILWTLHAHVKQQCAQKIPSEVKGDWLLSTISAEQKKLLNQEIFAQ